MCVQVGPIWRRVVPANQCGYHGGTASLLRHCSPAGRVLQLDIVRIAPAARHVACKAGEQAGCQRAQQHRCDAMTQAQMAPRLAGIVKQCRLAESRTRMPPLLKRLQDSEAVPLL